MAFQLIEELERVVAALEAAGIDYALCGGLAFVPPPVTRPSTSG